nr:hypothetical protein [Tanacetum cinerariifolium]
MPENARFVVASWYPATNNQLQTSLNPRQQATIKNGRVTIQPIQGRQNFVSAGSSRPFTSVPGGAPGKQRVIVCYNCKGEGRMSKHCTKPKRKRDAEWFKDKVNQDNKKVNELLTAELERYRKQERILTTQMDDDNKSTSYAHSVEIDSLKHTLSEHLKENESLEQKITLLKNDFQKKESQNIDRELALEKRPLVFKIHDISRRLSDRGLSALFAMAGKKKQKALNDDQLPSSGSTKGRKGPPALQGVNTCEALLSNITIGVLGLDEVDARKDWLSNITIGVLGLDDVDARKAWLFNITIGLLGLDEVDAREALLSSITIGVLGVDEVDARKPWLSNITIGILTLDEVDTRKAEENTSTTTTVTIFPKDNSGESWATCRR